MGDHPLHVGLVGVGEYSSTYHVPHLRRRDDAVIAAATDLDDRKETVIAATGTDSFFVDYREMIDAGLLDAVIVSTPHGLHFEHASYALSAGLHTMVDKPLTIRSANAWELVRIADESGVLLMTALNRHFDPASLYTKHAIASGAVGDVQLTTSLQRGFPSRGANAGWLSDPEIGGGMLYGRTCHMADLLPWLHDSRAAEVEARIEYHGPRDDPSTSSPQAGSTRDPAKAGQRRRGRDAGHHHASIVGLTLENGATAQMISLAASERHEDAIMVYASLESVHIARPPSGSPWVATRSREHHGFEPVPPEDLPPGSTSTDNFVDALLRKAQPMATGEDGARSVRVIEAAIESAATGQPVRV